VNAVAQLQAMPQITVTAAELRPFGLVWESSGRKLPRGGPMSSAMLGRLFDEKVGRALATMLGGIEIVVPKATALHPSKPDCVEVGPCRIVGGIRPQNFDVGYRPDGPRFVFDSKTLNDEKSIRKNYQNMINDLGTEATTVHTRFPYAVVAFLVVLPTPSLAPRQKDALTRTLERLSERSSPIDLVHKAEAISLVLWDPATGAIDQNWPAIPSPLRVENLSAQIERAYVERFKGLPLHGADEDATAGEEDDGSEVAEP
jgi:hypothetical protein